MKPTKLDAVTGKCWDPKGSLAILTSRVQHSDNKELATLAVTLEAEAKTDEDAVYAIAMLVGDILHRNSVVLERKPLNTDHEGHYDIDGVSLADEETVKVVVASDAVH